MTKLRMFLLLNGLLLVYATAAQAGVQPRKRPDKRPPTQYRSKNFVIPPKVPKKVRKPSPNTAEQPIPSSTIVTKAELQKRHSLTEEMLKQRTWMYSAALPGWGQVYNKHYWKVPAIYAVFAGLGWGAIYNHQEYVRAKKKLTSQKGGLTLAHYVNACRRDRDLFIIFAGLWYVANVFDAYVGASLTTFDLSDDISLEVHPSMSPTAQATSAVGLSLNLSLK